jgi:hypothetical protein
MLRCLERKAFAVKGAFYQKVDLFRDSRKDFDLKIQIMAGAYSLYLPSGFPQDLHQLLEDHALHVTTKPKKIGKSLSGYDHLISRDLLSICILESPPSEFCKQRYLLCLAKPKATSLLFEVASLLESLGACNTPE